MALTCLLLTSDAALLDVVRSTFGAVGVGAEHRADAASAIELTVRRHIDSFVSDCDDVHAATKSRATVRNSRSNKLSTIFAISSETVVGKIMNVSEGGLSLTHFGPAAVEGTVTIQFELPSTTAQVFRAKAEVVWKVAFAAGLRFLRIEPDCRLSFEAWLESLEAQLQFRESTQSSTASEHSCS